MNLRLSSSATLFVAPLLLVLSFSASALAQRKPVKNVLLFRADASLAPGSYQLEVRNADDESSSTYAFALGPRLGLNLGYAPSRLIRLGLGTAAAFSMTLAEDGDIPSAEVDGWARWTIGPSVGFRFGPKVPIELDVALNFATFQTLGSQASIPGDPIEFDALARRYGITSTALLLWRPGGAADPFALHAGLENTWGMDGGSTSRGTMLLQSLLLGISLGL